MKKMLSLFAAALFLLNTQLLTAGGNNNQTPKAKFQFTAFGVTQNSWDYSLLHFNINDLATGEAINIPSFLINYEVKDKAGKTVANGSGLYIKIMDGKLGPEEDYTVNVTTVINGEKISQSVCKKASPKQFALNIESKNADPSIGPLASNFSLTCTRPKFNHPGETETIAMDPSDVSVSVALDNCSNCGNFNLELGSSAPKLSDQTAYQDLENMLKKMTADGKSIRMTVSPTVSFNGTAYTEPKSRYDVTASSMTQVPVIDDVADK